MRVAGLLVLVALPCVVATAAAQTTPSQTSRLTVAAGLLTAGGYRIGDVSPQMRRSSPGAESLTPVLRAESEIEAAVGLEARVAWALRRNLGVEVGGGFTVPRLRATISQDGEVPGASASERLTQFATEVSGVYQMFASGSSPRVRPFIIGGAGYVWQLREDRVTRETGRTIHAGGGVNYVFRSGARARPFGVRSEARFVHRVGGIEFEDKARNYPTLSVLAFVGL